MDAGDDDGEPYDDDERDGRLAELGRVDARVPRLQRRVEQCALPAHEGRREPLAAETERKSAEVDPEIEPPQSRRHDCGSDERRAAGAGAPELPHRDRKRH